MERVLPAIHAIIFSLPNLRTVWGKGTSAARKQDEACKLIEYVTGVAPSTPLRRELRYWAPLLDLLTSQARLREERFKLVQLGTMEWSKQGLYELSQKGNIYTVLHRYTKRTYTFDIDDVDLPSGADLFVEYNWSETSACVKAAGVAHAGSTGLVLAAFFKQQHIQQLALQDTPSQQQLKRGRTGSSTSSRAGSDVATSTLEASSPEKELDVNVNENSNDNNNDKNNEDDVDSIFDGDVCEVLD
eukprot:4947707-Amphidinium_carterae.1